MQKFLIIAGIVIVAVGVSWPWIGKIPFGRLPGDITIEKENFRFYFPITTMIIVSIIISIIIRIFRK